MKNGLRNSSERALPLTDFRNAILDLSAFERGSRPPNRNDGLQSAKNTRQGKAHSCQPLLRRSCAGEMTHEQRQVIRQRRSKLSFAQVRFAA